MTAIGIVLAATAPAFVGCGEREPAPSQTAAEPKTYDWRPEYDEMASVLQLTPDEQARVQAAYEARAKKLEEWWNGPEGQALLEEERALKEATEARDLQGVRAVTRKDPTQRSKFKAIADETMADVIAALPPQKRIAWDGHRVAEKMLELMHPLELNDEQQNLIRTNAVSFVQTAVNAGEPTPPSAAFLALETWAENNVMTDPQYYAYEEIKKSNPMRSLGF